VATVAPSALLERVLEKTGYKRLLEGENNAEADARLENLRELYGSILDYETESEAAGEKPSLQGFLERVTLQSDIDALEADGGPSRRITLMTVHGAKGLEFDTVVLTGMEEEMFPYRGMEPGHDEELEEERRLAYVAITRARRRLVITHTEMRQIFGTTRWGRPSRFIDDVPADVTKHLATKGAQQRPRFVDRAPSFDADFAQPRGPWRHPQEAPARVRSEPERAPGERYVDTSFFGDESSDEMPIRRGSRVVHTRFGEGEVRRVERVGEPAVVAFFPGWGEKKILARFLKLA
jgi:DNA helicase-2/ATP-dependent DNA helicase PcrA